MGVRLKQWERIRIQELPSVPNHHHQFDTLDECFRSIQMADRCGTH